MTTETSCEPLLLKLTGNQALVEKSQVLFSYMVIEFTGNVASLPKKAARTCSAAFFCTLAERGGFEPP